MVPPWLLKITASVGFLLLVIGAAFPEWERFDSGKLWEASDKLKNVALGYVKIMLLSSVELHSCELFFSKNNKKCSHGLKISKFSTFPSGYI